MAATCDDDVGVVADEAEATTEEAKSLREWLSEAVSSLDPPKQTVSLSWLNEDSLPRTTERRVLPLVVEAGDYGPLAPEKWDRVLSHVRRQHFHIRLEQVVSLRSQYLSDKALRGHRPFVQAVQARLAEYAAGASILDIARQADVPPMTAMRELLKYKWQCSNPDIKLALEAGSQLFDERDRAQLQLAEQHDIVANLDKSDVQRKAQEFEERVHHYFTQVLHIRCQTERELKAHQLEVFNRQVATPDLLFLDRVLINGVEVHWIDAKDMYGSTVKMTARRLKAQAQKYAREWGPGAMLFARSFCKELRIPSVLLLDTSMVPALTVTDKLPSAAPPARRTAPPSAARRRPATAAARARGSNRQRTPSRRGSS